LATVLLPRKTHTQRRKATYFILFYFIFVAKIRQKVPHENIHGEANVLKNFQKKKLNHDIFRREKIKVLKSPYFEEENNRF
jgi:hypothetical protein